MSFVKYQKEKARQKGVTNSIGISRKGRFAFYKQVIQKHFNNAEYVEFFYDNKENKIGILPTIEPSTDSFKIQGVTTKTVTAKKFINRFQIPVEDRRYNFDFKDGMIIIQL
jgi:hypothetical protein